MDTPTANIECSGFRGPRMEHLQNAPDICIKKKTQVRYCLDSQASLCCIL